MDGLPIAQEPSLQFAYGETELWFTEHAMEAGSRIMYPGVAGITELDDHDNIVIQRRMLELTTVARHRMVRDERWKLVYVPTRKGVRYMLFDTRSDPNEVRDVAAAMPAELERLKAELWRWMLADSRMVKQGDYIVPRQGLGREAVTVAGRPAQLDRKRSAERDEVVLRLVDEVGTARFSLYDRDHVRDAVSGYPRKFRSPWHGGKDADLVQLFATHTAGVAAAQKPRDPKGSSPWMMEEGTLEQRESIVAPAPSELRIPVLLPRGARLEVSPAVLEPAGTATQFSVSVVANGKPAEQIWSVRLGPKQARKWLERTIDLSAHGGEKVELVLATARSPLLPDEENEEPAPPSDGDDLAHGKLPLAVWGDPVLLATRESQVPANVVFIVVDALRADAIASLHREDAGDAGDADPATAPLDARLPKVPGLTPEIDQLVTDGVAFTRAYSVASWTRPGTLALLSGKRSSELGVGSSSWVVSVAEAARFYRSEPPLLPLLLRSRGVRSRALVNNFFMLGHADVGLDMAFESLDDFRYATADTDAITKAAIGYLEAHRRERFFLFLNYNAPHAPYSAPPDCLARLPRRNPRDDKGGEQVRAYMAEACKDDDGIGKVIKKIDELGLRDEVIVVLSADHGETLSSAHEQLGLDGVPLRFHHAASNFEETIHVPIVLRYPPGLPKGKLIDVRVRTTDIAPTILDLLDLPQVPMSGRSLVPVVRGIERDDRPVVSEGRGPRGLLSGTFHYLQYDRQPGVTTPLPGPMLFDLSVDPGERRNVIEGRPDVAARMRDQLLSGAGQEAPPSASEPRFAFRFAGAGTVKRVRASIRFEKPPTLVPVGITMDELRPFGTQVEVALSTSPGAVVGFDAIGVQNSVQWQFYFDEVLVDSLELGGQYGLPLRRSRGGARSRDAFSELAAKAMPLIDPVLDDGVFVALLGRDQFDEPRGEGATLEMQRALEDWGYATKKPGGSR
jgi:arylsulfatase A-like enzyme